jgi:hypothetical protein
MCLLPQTFATLARTALEGGIELALRRRLLARVLLVVPREAGADLLESDVYRIRASRFALRGEHATDNTRIAVFLVPDHAHVPREDERGEMLLRALAVSLAALGRVDAREADAVLFVRGVEEGERVAVGDGDDAADDLGGGRGERERKKQQSERDTSDTDFPPRPRLCRGALQRTSGACDWRSQGEGCILRGPSLRDPEAVWSKCVLER